MNDLKKSPKRGRIVFVSCLCGKEYVFSRLEVEGKVYVQLEKKGDR